MGSLLTTSWERAVWQKAAQEPKKIDLSSAAVKAGIPVLPQMQQ